mmetsp:Transcript_66247/g.205258  ORF Transcript_66247/g.205258 Transcript_66247/m.205258 type:complete len:234 (+) Transcript_66247:2-703(+)
MWYLHNEVIGKPNFAYTRKYDITRILRYRVTMKTTQRWYSAFHHQFGPYLAFDSGRCSAPPCQSTWDKYGYIVGCQVLGTDLVNYPRDFELVDLGPKASTTTARPKMDLSVGGVWYSLPGPCPSMERKDKTQTCLKQELGGRCGSGTGWGNCTYQAELAGELRLDGLCGIHNYTAWFRAGNTEYDWQSDRGKGCSFWDGRHDLKKGTRRLLLIQRLFREKFPGFPVRLPGGCL